MLVVNRVLHTQYTHMLPLQMLGRFCDWNYLIQVVSNSNTNRIAVSIPLQELPPWKEEYLLMSTYGLNVPLLRNCRFLFT